MNETCARDAASSYCVRVLQGTRLCDLGAQRPLSSNFDEARSRYVMKRCSSRSSFAIIQEWARETAGIGLMSEKGCHGNARRFFMIEVLH